MLSLFLYRNIFFVKVVILLLKEMTQIVSTEEFYKNRIRVIDYIAEDKIPTNCIRTIKMYDILFSGDLNRYEELVKIIRDEDKLYEVFANCERILVSNIRSALIYDKLLSTFSDLITIDECNEEYEVVFKTTYKGMSNPSDFFKSRMKDYNHFVLKSNLTDYYEDYNEQEERSIPNYKLFLTYKNLFENIEIDKISDKIFKSDIESRFPISISFFKANDKTYRVSINNILEYSIYYGYEDIFKYLLEKYSPSYITMNTICTIIMSNSKNTIEYLKQIRLSRHDLFIFKGLQSFTSYRDKKTRTRRVETLSSFCDVYFLSAIFSHNNDVARWIVNESDFDLSIFYAYYTYRTFSTFSFENFSEILQKALNYSFNFAMLYSININSVNDLVLFRELIERDIERRKIEKEMKTLSKNKNIVSWITMNREEEKKRKEIELQQDIKRYRIEFLEKYINDNFSAFSKLTTVYLKMNKLYKIYLYVIEELDIKNNEQLFNKLINVHICNLPYFMLSKLYEILNEKQRNVFKILISNQYRIDEYMSIELSLFLFDKDKSLLFYVIDKLILESIIYAVHVKELSKDYKETETYKRILSKIFEIEKITEQQIEQYIFENRFIFPSITKYKRVITSHNLVLNKLANDDKELEERMIFIENMRSDCENKFSFFS